MKLEDLVPPLELCKLIPAGEFEGSAFMRGLHAEFDTVIHRENLHIFTVNGEAFFPAPTLEDVLNANTPEWDTAKITRMLGDKTPLATIALRSWLKTKGIDVK